MRTAGFRLVLAGSVGLLFALAAVAYGGLQHQHSEVLPYIDWLQDGHGRGFVWALVFLLSPLIIAAGVGCLVMAWRSGRGN